MLLGVLPKLGWGNVAYMTWYRASMRFGIRKRMFSFGNSVSGQFFIPTKTLSGYQEEWKKPLRAKGDSIVNGRLRWFSYHEFEVGAIPNWFKNPFTGEEIGNPSKHWTELSDFDINIGDIKTIWEPSRFDWMTDLARSYRVFGDEVYLTTLNLWLNDWSEKNPLNLGPNWKCGQETSIRVMKLMHTAFLLDQFENPSQAIQTLIYQHLGRIAGNIRYAVAQDNNHGTSEAAALWIGASWLLKSGTSLSDTKNTLQQWQATGMHSWNGRIRHLVGNDGTFAQRSINYHRVVVDTVSFVLFFANKLMLPKPPELVRKKLEAIVAWQVKFIVPENGDSPNIGLNDGAMLENLHGCRYRDFRPSAQLAHWLCFGYRVFEKGPWDEVLFWRTAPSWESIPLKALSQPKSEILDKQFLILRNGGTQVFLRIPDDGFRPTASDAFHIDVWHIGQNPICGCGSYSYNSKESFAAYFKSIQGHNTVQFGGHEQMPRISKFLLGKWITASKVSSVVQQDDSLSWSGTYLDAWGNEHNRTLVLHTNGTLEITDSVTTTEAWSVRYNLGTTDAAVITDTHKCVGSGFQLTTENESLITLKQGYASTHYLLCTPSQALNISAVGRNSTTVRITWD